MPGQPHRLLTGKQELPPEAGILLFCHGHDAGAATGAMTGLQVGCLRRLFRQKILSKKDIKAASRILIKGAHTRRRYGKAGPEMGQDNFFWHMEDIMAQAS